MNIILLSGGSGKRLWPLSNDIRSKQFIRIFNGPDGNESMVQRVYRQIQSVDPEGTVTIATSKTQVSALHNQLGENVRISVEPCRRDTFPAIALAAAFLRDVVGVPEEEAIVVCPVDPFVEEDYFRALQGMQERAMEDSSNLVLLGIQPTYPSEKYGYILPVSGDPVSDVKAFREKPCAADAAKYIERGALWNGGVFACRIHYVMEKARELLRYSSYQELFTHYEELPQISFDYAVVEKEPWIRVVRYEGTWKDIGTWNTLTEAMENNVSGNVMMNDRCDNVHVINELNVPILAMGLKDVIISASSEGILVSDKNQSSYIKPFVDSIDQQVMFAEKSWGSFTVLDVEEEALTIKIKLLPGHRLHYHSHEHRVETWTVISGEGIAVVDDAEVKLRPGIMLRLPVGSRHTVIAESEITLIEVQVGKNINVHDKKKYSLTERYGMHQ